MSQELRASLLSYEFSRRNHATSSSSSDHSPTSQRSRSSELFVKRPAVRVHGDRSYDARGRHKVKIPRIEETIARGHDTSVESQHHTRRGTKSSEDLRRSILINAATVVRSSLKSNKSSRESPRASKSCVVTSNQELEQDRPSITSAKSGRSSRPSWNRTRSGGVWYQIPKNTSSQDGTSTPPRTDSSAPSPFRIEPLKPPPRPDRPESAATDHVTVDTPFSQAEEQLDSSLQRDSITVLRTERRRSSVDARKLLSTPLQILRRVVPTKLSVSSSSPATPRQSDSQLPQAQTKNHKSLPKQDQTGSTLERVASLLEAQRTPKPPRRLGGRTRLQSASTSSSSEVNDSRVDTTATISSTFNISSKGSGWASTTSSMLRILMGSMPQNSPSESAIYKIKRSPSAETEEFFKIDISVRGGTSYLPSEARRVYTPPLPGDNNTDSRRGYFFDNTAPSAEGNLHQKSILSRQSPQPPKAASPSKVNTRPLVEQDEWTALAKTLPPSPRVRTSNSSRVPSWRTTTTAQPYPVEFYDVKLADIDAISTEIDIITKEREQEKREQCKNKCQAKIAEIKRQQDEAQLDYSIPEHLPSSPLCPRNPRYWRVVRNKGSQFRGCWMHGFGEYDIVPGLRTNV